MLSDDDPIISVYIYGLIEATSTALKLHGKDLSQENFITHDWSILNKEGELKLFQCKRCALLCGLMNDEVKFKILSTTNLSCDELKLAELLK